MIRIVTAYTPDYSGYAERLGRSAEHFGVAISSVPFQSRGSWGRNCAIKPEAIAGVMQETGDDCLWLDADMWLLSWPEEFAPGDIVLRYGPTPEPIAYDFEQDRIFENTRGIVVPWDGVALYRATERVARLLPEWKSLIDRYGHRVDDEQCLRLAMTRIEGLEVGIMDIGFVGHAIAGYQHGKPANYTGIGQF